MKKLDNKIKILFAIVLVVGFSIGSFLILNDPRTPPNLQIKDYPIIKPGLRCNQIFDGDRLVEENCRNKNNFDYNLDYAYSTTSTGNSMYPAIQPGYKLYYEFIDEDDMVVTGETYVYRKNETAYVAHRLIGMCDANTMIFKGDNNNRVEVIDRDLIERRLIGIRWD